MSILIKGMEMPTDCALMLKIFPDGRVGVPVHLNWAGTMVVKDTEAVHVPPHGRLIDADALMKEFEKAQRTMEQHGQEYSCSFMSSSQEISTEWYCVEDMVENAPTIIPADPAEEVE